MGRDVIGRSTTVPPRSHKGQRPKTAPPSTVFLGAGPWTGAKTRTSTAPSAVPASLMVRSVENLAMLEAAWPRLDAESNAVATSGGDVAVGRLDPSRSDV